MELQVQDLISAIKKDGVKEVTDALKGALAEKIRGGLEIKANPNVRAGFRLVAKDGTGYFDCTDEAILQMLLPFFSDLVI